jgi:hypothetical protein
MPSTASALPASSEQARDEAILRAEDKFRRHTSEAWKSLQERREDLAAERDSLLARAETAADLEGVEAWHAEASRRLEEDCMWDIRPALLVRDSAIYGAKMRYADSN